jgi:hypothetical protein
LQFRFPSNSETISELKLTETELKVKVHYAPIAIKLIATANEHVERLFSMLRQQVDPDGVIAALKSWSTEVIRVHTGAEAIALVWIDALNTALKDNDLDHSQSKPPDASSDDEQGRKNSFRDHR